MRRWISLLIGLGLLGCAPLPTPRAQLQPVLFSGPALPVRVAMVQIVTTPFTGNLADQFPLSAVAMLENWAQHRFLAAGGSGVMTITIEADAHSSYTPPRGDLFARRPAQEELLLRARLTARLNGQTLTGHAEAKGEIKGNPSLIEREEILHDLLRALAAEVDRVITPDWSARLR